MDRVFARLLGGLLGLAVVLPHPSPSPSTRHTSCSHLRMLTTTMTVVGTTTMTMMAGAGAAKAAPVDRGSDPIPSIRLHAVSLLQHNVRHPFVARPSRSRPRAERNHRRRSAGGGHHPVDQEGYAVAERQSLGVVTNGSATEIVRLVVPRGTGSRRRARGSHPLPDRSGRLQSLLPARADGNCPRLRRPDLRLVREIIGWPIDPAGLVQRCGSLPTIGLIDTAINPDHPSLGDARLEVIRITDDALPQSGRQHGTAVAALLVGAAGSRAPGLLPSSEVLPSMPSAGLADRPMSPPLRSGQGARCAGGSQCASDQSQPCRSGQCVAEENRGGHDQPRYNSCRCGRQCGTQGKATLSRRL